MDRWGNVAGRDYTGSDPNVPGDLNLPVDTSTNRLNGYAYDCLGNQTQIEQDGTTLNLNYLDQGHAWEVSNVSGSLQYRYYYDADGKRRIKAKASDGLTNFQEDASYYFYDGEALACQLDIGELVQADEEAYQPKFLMLDHLGSTRAEITFEGTGLTPTVSGRYDYMPYGQFINAPDTTPEQVCFTGKQRDIESGLDGFGPRYFSNILCRWISPDQPLIDNMVEDPQSWNLFSYVINNPMNLIEVGGLKETAMSSTGAADLARPENTYPISGDKPGSLGLLDTAKSGDLLLMDYTGAGRVTHTQVVTASNSDIVRINQGNMHGGSSGYGSSFSAGHPSRRDTTERLMVHSFGTTM